MSRFASSVPASLIQFDHKAQYEAEKCIQQSRGNVLLAHEELVAEPIDEHIVLVDSFSSSVSRSRSFFSSIFRSSGGGGGGAPACRFWSQDEITPPSLDNVMRAMKSCTRVLVMLGAGASVNLGIPSQAHLRSLVGSGAAQSFLDYHRFMHDPRLFYAMAGSLIPTNAVRSLSFSACSTAHAILNELQRSGRLLRVYSQNVDGFETFNAHLAGISPLPEKRVVFCFGTFASARCMRCKAPVDASSLRDLLVQNWDSFKASVERGREAAISAGLSEEEFLEPLLNQVQLPPPCSTCASHLIKPDVTLEGENVDSRFKFFDYEKDVVRADILLMLGCSRIWQPVMQIFHRVAVDVPRVVFDCAHPSKTNDRHQSELMVGPIRPFQWWKGGGRDVWVSGDLQKSASLLLNKCIKKLAVHLEEIGDSDEDSIEVII